MIDEKSGAYIGDIRHFGRYYTDRIGLLSKYRFDSAYTLAEARVLLEIGYRDGCAASSLLAVLGIDSGYLSRIVAKFVRLGLVRFEGSESDRRTKILRLTEAGRKELGGIDEKSDRQAAELVRHVGAHDLNVLTRAMKEIERIIGVREANGIDYRFVSSPELMPAAREVIREYADYLGIDLAFQRFEEELAGLPGNYAPPNGALILAFSRNATAGCVALRAMDSSTCEMKRLYVRPAFRKRGIGRRLAELVIERAISIGYRKMRLDTLDSLKEAATLYRDLGFREIPAYYDNPVPGALYFEYDLSSERKRESIDPVPTNGRF